MPQTLQGMSVRMLEKCLLNMAKFLLKCCKLVSEVIPHKSCFESFD